MNVNLSRIANSFRAGNKAADAAFITAQRGSQVAMLGAGAGITAYGGYRSIKNAQKGHYAKSAAWGAVAASTGYRAFRNASLFRTLR